MTSRLDIRRGAEHRMSFASGARSIQGFGVSRGVAVSRKSAGRLDRRSCLDEQKGAIHQEHEHFGRGPVLLRMGGHRRNTPTLIVGPKLRLCDFGAQGLRFPVALPSERGIVIESRR